MASASAATQPNLDADVVVIGGGPGGSTAATALAQKGLHAVLLEREHFPREHIGESLLPASMPFLEWLGVLPRIEEAGYLQKWGATMVWGRKQEPWSWYFRETNKRYPHTYQVWRADFDRILLDNARRAGADVREGHRVTAVDFEGGRATGVRYRVDGGPERSLRADFVVDASGQAALLGHHLSLRRWDDFFRNMAVYAYFRGAERLPAPDENNLLVESYADGWTWNIPLHTGVMSVGAVVDRARGQEELRRLGARAFLYQETGRAPYTSSMLAAADLASEVSVIKDWSYLSSEVIGEGYILVGDAACFVDPLFSSGVHLAMMSAAMAAAYVMTALRDPAMAGPAAAFYKEHYYQEYTHFHALARMFYATNRSVESYFWEARRMLGSEGEGLGAREAFLRAVGGRPPRGYERVVIDAGELPSGFARQLSTLQAASEQRRSSLEALPGGVEALLATAPHLAAGVELQRQPEIRDGEFTWGYALAHRGQRLGAPCSELVAALLSRLDGRTPVRDVIAGIGRKNDAAATQTLRRAAFEALQDLHLEGLITGLV